MAISSMLTPRRIASDELLDEHDAPEREMARSLRDLRRLNGLAGGTRVYLSLVGRAVGRSRAPFSILDLGTGTSDLLEAAQRRWPACRAIGLDRNVRHLTYGVEIGEPGVDRLAADAFHLPIRDAAVDVVASSHFFHHFSPDENAGILRESLRVARRCVIVTDTRRHYAPLAFVRLLGLLGLVGEITRYDAPASVLQGYTIPEVREIAAMAGGSRFELMRMLPFRFGLLVWK